jgi:single-strand DNA-binding protein
MSGLNCVHIIGRLVRDPEMKQASMKVCNFSIATSKKKKDGTEKTEFHNLVAFNKTAELVANYLKKGSQCYVQGELQTDNWVDQQTQKKMYKTSIVVNNVQFLDPKGQGGQQQQYQQQPQGFQQPPQAVPSQQQFQPGPPQAGSENLPF